MQWNSYKSTEKTRRDKPVPNGVISINNVTGEMKVGDGRTLLDDLEVVGGGGGSTDVLTVGSTNYPLMNAGALNVIGWNQLFADPIESMWVDEVDNTKIHFTPGFYVLVGLIAGNNGAPTSIEISTNALDTQSFPKGVGNPIFPMIPNKAQGEWSLGVDEELAATIGFIGRGQAAPWIPTGLGLTIAKIK